LWAHISFFFQEVALSSFFSHAHAQVPSFFPPSQTGKMHGRKRETAATRLERRAKSLPKVKLLQKLHKEIVHIPNLSSSTTTKTKTFATSDDDGDDTKAKKMELLMLSLTQKLVEIQPEMITCWNKRKARFCLYKDSDDDDDKEKEKEERLLRLKNITKEELHVSEQGLRRNPKSYCAWEHRRWVIARMYDRILSSSSSSSKTENENNLLLPFMEDIVLREREMLETLLNADDRNFHAWNYRRFVVDKISRYHFSDGDRMNNKDRVDVDYSDAAQRKTREDEAKYAREKISKNFSNYSAWHHRSVHFERLDDKDEKDTVASETWFQALLDAEFELVSQAFFTEPEDQSAWMYHRWLLSQLDMYSSSSDSSSSKKAYKVKTLQRELHRINEVFEMEPTCKWPALVCARLHKLLAKEETLRDAAAADDDAKNKEHAMKAKELYEKLLVLDPLRKGYYRDVLDRM
jgi:geranylgeranyl transferase type-2 subunit alpha